MNTKTTQQLNTLQSNRSSNRLHDGDLFDVSIDDGSNTHTSTKIPYETLLSNIEFVGIGDDHKLMISNINSIQPHGDVEVNRVLEYGDGLVWDTDHFTNTCVINGSDIDWVYKKITNSNIPITQTYNSNNTNTTYTYNLSSFHSDIGVSTSNIIGVMISSETTEQNTETKIEATYPDGELVCICNTDVNSSSTTPDTITTNTTTFLPIVKGQESFDIKMTIGGSGTSTFKIDYLMERNIQETSPDFDVIHFICSTDNVTPMSGFIDCNTPLTTDTLAWISSDPMHTHTSDLSSIMPIELDNDVTKTVIKYDGVNTNGSSSNDEEKSYGYITIDWIKHTINGVVQSNDNTHPLDNKTIVFGLNPDSPDNHDNQIIELLSNDEGKQIIKLPKPDGIENYGNLKYSITNYKTIRLTDTELNQQPTQQATTGVKQFSEYTQNRCEGTIRQTGQAYITNDDKVMVFGELFDGRFGIEDDGVNQPINAPGRELYHLDFYTIPNNKPDKVYLTSHSVYIITKRGYVYACGMNTYGNFSNGGTLDQQLDLIRVILPVDVSVKKLVIDPISNRYPTFYVTTDNRVFGAGYGGEYILDGVTTSTADTVNKLAVEVIVDGLDIIDVVSVGNADGVICVLLSDGTIRTRGTDLHGTLGNGSQGSHTTEWQDIGLTDVVEIQGISMVSDTNYHFISDEAGLGRYGAIYALKSNSDLYGWGYNGYGNLTNIANYDKDLSIPQLLSTNVKRFWVHSTIACHVFILKTNDVLQARGFHPWDGNGLGVLDGDDNVQYGSPEIQALIEQTPNMSAFHLNEFTDCLLTGGLDPSKIIEMVYGGDHGGSYIVCEDGIYACGDFTDMLDGQNTYKFKKLDSTIIPDDMFDYVRSNISTRPVININNDYITNFSNFVGFEEHFLNPDTTYIGNTSFGLDRFGNVYGCGDNIMNGLGSIGTNKTSYKIIPQYNA